MVVSHSPATRFDLGVMATSGLSLLFFFTRLCEVSLLVLWFFSSPQKSAFQIPSKSDA